MTRPETETSPAFDLTYIRTGNSDSPFVVIPGGPGLGSVLPYRGFRQRASKSGWDVLMIEHRGVGLSRTSGEGEDLPPSAITLSDAADDVAAVLEAEGLSRAFLYGSSYGSYLAQLFAVRHPERVAGMVLDSAMSSAHDHHDVRAHARDLLWEGNSPDTKRAAAILRQLVETETVSVQEGCQVSRIVYEFGGVGTLEGLLEAHAAGRVRRTWNWLHGLGAKEVNEVTPFVMEFDLVGRIAFRELNFAPAPDHEPFDPAASFGASIAAEYEPFDQEPVQLADHWQEFTWPTAVLTGQRDLRTPLPVAQRIAEGVADGVLMTIPDTGHSALDTHSLAAIAAMEAIAQGRHHELASDPTVIAGLRRTGLSRHLGTMARVGYQVERRIPAFRRGADRRK